MRTKKETTELILQQVHMTKNSFGAFFEILLIMNGFSIKHKGDMKLRDFLDANLKTYERSYRYIQNTEKKHVPDVSVKKRRTAKQPQYRRQFKK